MIERLCLTCHKPIKPGLRKNSANCQCIINNVNKDKIALQAFNFEL